MDLFFKAHNFDVKIVNIVTLTLILLTAFEVFRALFF